MLSELCIQVRKGFWPAVSWINRERANKITCLYFFLLLFNVKNVEVYNRNVKTDMSENV